MSIFTSSDGSTGPKVSINKALLLSALTIEADDLEQTDNTSRNQWSVVNAFNTAAARSTNQQTHLHQPPTQVEWIYRKFLLEYSPRPWRT